MLNSLPKYANSQVWQEMIKRKAVLTNEVVGGTPSKKQNQQLQGGSPRAPGFSHRSPLNATTNFAGKKHS